MKAGPVVAMLLLLALGMWMVLQPTLSRERSDITISVGAEAVLARAVPATDSTPPGYVVVSPERLASEAAVDAEALMAIVDRERDAWDARPGFERTLLGFFNITSWWNFGWVLIGLGGQVAFFGRMMVQWVVSEKSRKSQVPELFWWLSLLGGVCLFSYFVWRVDVVGVLGQSTGIVIYARNLRLISKQKRREQRDGPTDTAAEHPGTGD